MTDIEVDRIGSIAADIAYQLDDPHPPSSTPASRMLRALYAYEWAKENKHVTQVSGFYVVPSPAQVREAVLARESRDFN